MNARRYATQAHLFLEDLLGGFLLADMAAPLGALFKFLLKLAAAPFIGSARMFEAGRRAVQRGDWQGLSTILGRLRYLARMFRQ
jgi:hypothetical protein